MYIIKIVVTNIKLSFSSLKVRQKQHPTLTIIASACLFVAKELNSSCCFNVTVPGLTKVSGKAISG